MGGIESRLRVSNIWENIEKIIAKCTLNLKLSKTEIGYFRIPNPNPPNRKILLKNTNTYMPTYIFVIAKRSKVNLRTVLSKHTCSCFLKYLMFFFCFKIRIFIWLCFFPKYDFHFPVLLIDSDGSGPKKTGPGRAHDHGLRAGPGRA